MALFKFMFGHYIFCQNSFSAWQISSYYLKKENFSLLQEHKIEDLGGLTSLYFLELT